MKLADILKRINIQEWIGRKDLILTDICYHSNKALPGSIFVAIEGLLSDGHRYIGDAVSRGAIAIVISRDISLIDIPSNFAETGAIVRVDDTRKALSNMAANFYDHPSKEMHMVGVTGTNGKTTTTWLIHAILSLHESNVGQIGSLGILKDGKWEDSSHTTPESLELQKTLRDMKDLGARACVMEVSSHALALGRVRDINYDAAVFTNLTHEHLDFHISMEQYYKAKRKLFQISKSSHVINIDDPYGRQLVTDLSDSNPDGIVTYGLDGEGDYKGHILSMQGRETEFLLSTPDGEVSLKTSLPGKYNVYNCVAAAAYAHANGISLSTIKHALEQVKQIPGRFEVISAEGNINIIIDYAHTPDGFQQLLETVSQTASGRIIMVFGCVGERDQSKRSVMGKIASRYSDLCVLTTDNCRSEDPKDINQEIKRGLSYDTDYVEILDRREAIRYAILHRRENDTILITGKGHEQRQIIGNETFLFDEKAIITEALEDRIHKLALPELIDQNSVSQTNHENIINDSNIV